MFTVVGLETLGKTQVSSVGLLMITDVQLDEPTVTAVPDWKPVPLIVILCAPKINPLLGVNDFILKLFELLDVKSTIELMPGMGLQEAEKIKNKMI